MAQEMLERPPDPVIKPSCMYCAAGEKPKRDEHRGPLLHPRETGPDHCLKKVICPLNNHPLVVKQFDRISNWGEWRRLWDEAKSYEQLLGLLHVGLEVSRHKSNWEDPILFYLALADGWKDSYSSSAHEKTTLNELKAKAWKVLVMHHWKIDKDQRWAVESAWSEFLELSLVDPILDFFLRPDNLPRSDSEISENRAAYAFLEWMVEMLWRRCATNDMQYLITDQSRREKVMRLLIKMEKFGDLMSPTAGLTRADRRFLKRLAFTGTDPGTTLWQVIAGTIKDCRKRGNAEVARLLINDFIKRREFARAAKEERVEWKKRQEEDRQKEIAQAVADAAAATQRLRELTDNSKK